MSCPDIYINPTYWTTPHAGEYGNTAIDVGAGGITFTTGVARTIQVTVRNHGTDDSPNSRLQLYWADPGTSFTLMGQVDVDKFGIVPGGDGVATDGPFTENFSFNPSAAITWPNGGHVCLLARVQNESPPTGVGCVAQGYTTPATAATDARSAVRNIFVVAPPPPPPKSKGMTPAGGDEKGMNFAFAASDAHANRGETRLEVRALDPRKDRERLRELIADPAVFDALSKRQAKFATPAAVLFGEGTERVLLPRPQIVLKRKDALIGQLPRIGRLGPLSNATAARLLQDGTKLAETKRPASMKLAPGEMRQAIVHVIPKGENEIYAVTVEHKGQKDRTIGGLILLFVSPPAFF